MVRLLLAMLKPKATGCVFTDRLRKTLQRHFSTILFGELRLWFRATVRGVIRARVGVKVRVGVLGCIDTPRTLSSIQQPYTNTPTARSRGATRITNCQLLGRVETPSSLGLTGYSPPLIYATN